MDREWLLRRLDRLAPLTVIRGLPGMGKTTLAATWAARQRAQGAHVVWLNARSARASRGDVFAELLRNALVEGGLVTAAALRLESTGSGEWGAQLAEDLSDHVQQLVLVIDDADPLTDPATAAGLCLLLSQLPTVHILVCARTFHPIEEEAEVHELPMTVLTGRDLSVTVGELPTFAASWGHELSHARALELHGAVGGWLAAAKLVLDRTPPTAASFASDVALHLLREAVLPQIVDDGVAEVAMCLAVAEEITEDLVRTLLVDDPYTQGLLGNHTPASLLVRLERHGLLEEAPMRPDARAWRFPVLVGRLLADTLAGRHPERVAHVHRAIARMLVTDARAGAQKAVLRHARAGEDWPLLARQWTARSLQLVVAHPDAAVAAYADPPRTAVEEHPILGLAAATMTGLRPHVDDRTRAGHLGAQLRHLGAMHAVRRFRTHDEQSLAVAAAMAAHRVDGDPFAALRLAQDFTNRVDAEGSILPTISAGNAALLDAQWALTALLADDTPTALERATRSYHAATGEGMDLVAGMATAHLSLIHATLGSTGDARFWLGVHEGLATQPVWLDHLVSVPAHIARALLHLDELDDAAAGRELALAGDGTDAVEVWPFIAYASAREALVLDDPVPALARLEHLGTVHPRIEPRGTARWILDRCSAELMLAQGELNRAQRLIAGAVTGPGAVASAVPRARLALIAGEYALSHSIVSQNLWDRRCVPRDRAELLMIQAAAAVAMDDRSAAAEAFTRGHRLARHIGTLVPLTTLPRRTRDRLLQLTDIDLDADVRRRIDARPDVYPESGKLVTLSPREAVVLDQMVHHDTVAEIARALTVSVNTVKKQTIAIYAKLGVHDRASALLQAYGLGLLPGRAEPGVRSHDAV
ncbi:LuxR C-terminal-related transcriptional regulator [Georgenia halophila]|uniref:LuxR C-terminal-related transcriptional regulator n=1 Tax=Georgenia halophila TaxID=620889 RepID=A0ABP8LIU4_9MICO